MGRELRVIDPDSVYHVVSTGSNKGPIAWTGDDYDSPVRELAKAATRYKWEVYAWCVMTTHHHVVVRAPKNGLSAGFQLVNGSHSRRMSRRYTRTAHLFHNRPTVIEMQSQAHLVAGILYVVRNPIAAGICERASQWPFSSYRATVGLVEPPPWLRLDMLFELFGDPAEFARLVHGGHLPVSDTDGSR